LRGHAGVDILVRQAPGGVFGQEQLSDLPFRVGKRRRNRVPAIENHRPVRARIPPPVTGRTGEFPPFFEGFAAATAERRLGSAIAHGELVSRGGEYGNLGGSRAVFKGLPWLTLPPPIAHKRAGRSRFIRARGHSANPWSGHPPLGGRFLTLTDGG